MGATMQENFHIMKVEERPKHSAVSRNPPGYQSSRRISRTSRRSSSIGCRSLMIGRRSSAGLLAWTSCQDPSRELILSLNMSEDESVYCNTNFQRNATPIAMENYRDDVISDDQQNVLNDLKNNLARENSIYLNNHKEVGRIATLVLMEILEKTPKNMYAHAASFLRDPKTPDLIANFSYSDDLVSEKLIDIDTKFDGMVAAENINCFTSMDLSKK